MCVMGCAFLCIFLLLLHASAMDTSEKRLNDYGYHFNVTSVHRCPMNISEHEKAEARLGCKENQGYHCIPDKYHSSLIEFCYPKKRILVHTGNCLELADIGILNHVKCQTFSCGCPEAPYYSNEMYRFPVCLNVAFNCFTSDIACLQEKVDGISVKKFQNDGEQNRNDTFQSDGKHKRTYIILVLLIFETIILLVVLVWVLVLCIFKRKEMLIFWRDVIQSKKPTSISLEVKKDHRPISTNVEEDEEKLSLPTAAEVDKVEQRPETKCMDPTELPNGTEEKLNGILKDAEIDLNAKTTDDRGL
uniref:Uncharacterized protein LOC111106214 isoform X2 n=1 Tax=Crassostrea virginica TaxID=6565 RepID=A0A8B8AZB3_CRAVI|nr:uncharacterized protein LOC111106214 isoform X2 [Crassostrea virginica]